MLSNSRANEHDLCYRCGAQMPDSTRHAPNPKRTATVHQTWRLIQRIRFLVMRVSQAQLVGTLIIEGVGPALSRRALRHSQKDCLPGKLPVARLSGYGASALTKLAPLGVPTPVTLSQPTPVVSEVSVPKVITNQRVENGLLYNAL